MATVNLVNVSKRHGAHLILDKLNLEINKGEFVAVVGPSGCGKSTLLRLVAGLETVSEGNILINNECVNSIVPFKRDIAMVFQNYALYPHMTVFENMAYALKKRKLKSNVIEQKVKAAANLLQLNDYLNRKPGMLSGGQRQRVAMGRAIVRSPAIFLFDEPLSNLDAKLRTEMRLEIRKLHQQLKTTCLYVTHDQIEAMTMASRVLILNKGCVEQIGTPKQIYQQPRTLFVASFTSAFPINFLKAQLDNSHLVSEIGLKFPILDSLSANQFIIGIRPEDFKIVPKMTDNSVEVRVDLIDDLGSDKLIHAETKEGLNLTIRASADIEIIDNHLSLAVALNKANLFDESTGLRIGGWNDNNKE
ncbi:MAG: sn-glycerol-3-phosphate ABC transporter ATP-binding protein UgpC [Proteobacteria bacterium]|nr:sn-glycerol-3-phosphate ABC transporter ATP-binding protein UgpC [Pseudomonadota bacterium]